MSIYNNGLPNGWSWISNSSFSSSAGLPLSADGWKNGQTFRASADFYYLTYPINSGHIYVWFDSALRDLGSDSGGIIDCDIFMTSFDYVSIFSLF